MEKQKYRGYHDYPCAQSSCIYKHQASYRGMPSKPFYTPFPSGTHKIKTPRVSQSREWHISVPEWRILHLRTNSPDDKDKHAPLCQLDVSLFAGILLCCSCELFSYDQLTDVNAVAQKVRDHLFSMSYCSIGVSETHRHVM